jgi:glycosyltransferase involved in cell wall biosynthesis
MRVLVVTNYLTPYRVDFLNEVAAQLGEGCCRVLFWRRVHPQHPWEIDEDRIRFPAVHVEDGSGRRRWTRVLASCRELAPTRAVVAGLDPAALAAAGLARAWGAQVYQWSEEREAPASPVRRAVREVARPLFHGVVATSSGAAGYFRSSWKLGEDRVCTVLQNPAWPLATELPGGREGELRLLYVGQLAGYKRVDRLLDLLHRLCAREVPATLKVVGGGPEEARLRGLVERLGLRERVEFTGYVADRQLLNEIYRSADVFVLGSRETFGAVVVEALSHGLVLVTSTEAGATRDTVEPGRNGVPWNVRDPAPVVEYLSSLVREPSRLVEAKRASLRIASRYGPDALASRLLSFLSAS